MKSFTQLRIQEKVGGNDFRAFLTCRDSKNNTWEFRGYGETVALACADVMHLYSLPDSDWHLYGYIVRKAKTRKAPTKRNYIKVLPLPDALTYVASLAKARTYTNESGEVIEVNKEAIARLVRNDLHGWKLTQIDPVFNRDGWYYDRLAKQSWYEIAGTAWKVLPEFTHTSLYETSFLYELETLNIRMLSQAELDAIHTLKAYRNCPESLKEMLYLHNWAKANRDIERESAMSEMLYLREN